MKLYTDRIRPAHIRALHNTFRDGTATDAVARLACRVALGELCVGDDAIPGGLRYPTESEIDEAKTTLCRTWNERHGDKP